MAWGAGEGERVNLGGSPGDQHFPEPYAYVGPWGPARPGDPGFWNAPFGAVLPWQALLGADLPAAVERVRALAAEAIERRIVTGGSPPSSWYYTDDHYRSFSPIDPDEESLP